MPRHHTHRRRPHPFGWLLPVVVALLLRPAPAAAQVAGSDPTAVIEARAGRGDLRGALADYRRLLGTTPTAYDALCNAARIAVDLAEFEADRPTKDALYAEAMAWARAAVAARPTGADGHFHIARALGHTALNAGPRERVQLAVEVKDRAQTALRLAPDHAGALHVIGMWHAEVMRLNSVARAMARTFLGGGALGEASWTEAVRYLERAVAVEPDRIVHRLDLALVYRDVGRAAEARAQLDWIAAARPVDYNDPRNQQRAAAARARMR
jgi:tetratricopeptide (TPR) repeat protein